MVNEAAMIHRTLKAQIWTWNTQKLSPSNTIGLLLGELQSEDMQMRNSRYTETQQEIHAALKRPDVYAHMKISMGPYVTAVRVTIFFGVCCSD